MNFVLLETAGKQRYIFESNRLRENIGASELVLQAGTDLVDDSTADTSSYQQVYATSGKALIAAVNEEAARDLVYKVSSKALQVAPGLDVYGAVSPAVEMGSGKVAEMVESLYRMEWLGREERGRELTRFPRLPFGADCDSSVFPASRVVIEKDGTPRSQSIPTRARYDAYEDAKQRLTGEFLEAAWDIDELEDAFGRLEWLGVIRVDGNGFGRLFRDLAENTGANDLRYLFALRWLSKFLDALLSNSLKVAVREHLSRFPPKQGRRIIVPILQGGDDLTFLCDGRSALQLAQAVLDQIECANLSPSPGDWDLPNGFIKGGAPPGPPEDLILSLLSNHQVSKHLTACAGIAITKPHFPFWAAYELASELAESAKVVKAQVLGHRGMSLGLSALDYHVLLDGAADKLDVLRERMKSRDGCALAVRPLITSKTDNLPKSSEDWVQQRSMAGLKAMVDRFRERDPGSGRPSLSHNKIKELAQLSATGKEVATQFWSDWCNAEPDQTSALREVMHNEIFYEESVDGTWQWATRFCDAVELEEFLPVPVPVSEGQGHE